MGKFLFVVAPSLIILSQIFLLFVKAFSISNITFLLQYVVLTLTFLFPFFKVIGNGSFGVVYQAKLCETGEMVAIKKVLQDKR